RQWLFILGGFAIVAHLGMRMSRSPRGTLAAMTSALLILAITPIYHHDKLFLFPLIVWVGWRYIDHPMSRRGATCGCVTAMGFLFRHDYGVYLGAASVITFILARVAVPESRCRAQVLRDAGAYVGAIGVVLAPWLIAVERSDGLVYYTRSHAELFEGAPGIA